MKYLLPLVPSIAVFGLLTLVPDSGRAASNTWDGGGANGNWSTPGNWVGDTNIPGVADNGVTTTNTDTATFFQPLGTSPIVIDAGGRNLQNITFDTNTNVAFVIGTVGGTNALLLTNGGAITNKTSTSTSNAQTINAPIVIQGNGGSYTFDQQDGGTGAAITFNGPISGVSTSGNTTTLTLTASNNGVSIINGKVSDGSGGGKLSISSTGNSGTWRLTGSNDYTGGTTISTGNILVGNNSALGTGTVTFSGANAGTLGVTGATAITLANNINLQHSGGSGSGNISSAASTAALTLSGTITNVGGGSRVVTLSNTNGTTLSGNILLSDNSNAGTLNFQPAANTTATISGVISNGTAASGAITKSATGTLVLTGSNTYTGATTISAGTLLINGNNSSATGAVAVNTGGTLGGNGTIGGAVTVANSTTAILAPGTLLDSTETLTLNNKDLTFSGVDSQLKIDITGTSAGSFDRIVGVNSLTANGDITFTLSGTYGTASWDVLDFTSKTGNFDTITLAGSYSGSLLRSGDTWTGTVGGQAWTFEQTTGVLSVVPEPTTWALLAASATFLVVTARRRRGLLR
ncbi:fibronectin-binding autotransporter adhesin [Terrimicrobium sacchariphilum]|uniref:Fibronectin-binding autotransporter adhesin n=1 Tax=Terrimicrobium sacchariphilum TaxID=690879 RepID=A0A146G633_TERSA|nr:autotransporter-associated beta strand repeat-containing protein [Terrimicrobium sacchariphilum]GAT32186.1 fibronectin-binding autotransporter adhesin [Terrimicrobium sacchariphilum]